MASGATPLLRVIRSCIFHCWPTSNRKAKLRDYGAYREIEGVTERALFVIDTGGSIQWSYCSPIAINPGADGILEALERLPK